MGAAPETTGGLCPHFSLCDWITKSAATEVGAIKTDGKNTLVQR